MGFGTWEHAALKGHYLVLREWRDGRSMQVALTNVDQSADSYDAVVTDRPRDWRARRSPNEGSRPTAAERVAAGRAQRNVAVPLVARATPPAPALLLRRLVVGGGRRGARGRGRARRRLVRGGARSRADARLRLARRRVPSGGALHARARHRAGGRVFARGRRPDRTRAAADSAPLRTRTRSATPSKTRSCSSSGARRPSSASGSARRRARTRRSHATTPSADPRVAAAFRACPPLVQIAVGSGTLTATIDDAVALARRAARALRHDHRRVRAAARRAPDRQLERAQAELGACEPNNPRDLARILDATTSPDAAFRRIAIERLEGADAAVALRPWTRGLEDSSRAVRRVTARVLADSAAARARAISSSAPSPTPTRASATTRSAAWSRSASMPSITGPPPAPSRHRRRVRLAVEAALDEPPPAVADPRCLARMSSAHDTTTTFVTSPTDVGCVTSSSDRLGRVRRVCADAAGSTANPDTTRCWLALATHRRSVAIRRCAWRGPPSWRAALVAFASTSSARFAAAALAAGWALVAAPVG